MDSPPRVTEDREMPKSVTMADNQIDKTGKDQLTMPGAEVLLKALENDGSEQFARDKDQADGPVIVT